MAENDDLLAWATLVRAPGLDVVLVGEDPASAVYTRNKEKASNEVGIRGRLGADGRVHVEAINRRAARREGRLGRR